MSSNILIFEEFAESGRGFLARPILPDNTPALRGLISEIGYTVKNMTDNTMVTGDLDPAIVMMLTIHKWKYDEDGYSFFWAVPGTLWPTPGISYRVAIDFLVDIPGSQMDGFAFKLAWQNNAKDVLG